MKRILIIGAGDLGIQFHHFISNYSNDVVSCWLDDTKENGEFILNAQVKGGVKDLMQFRDIFDCVAVAIGYNHLETKREIISELLNKKIELYSFIHPSSYVDLSAEIKTGVFIYPGVVVDQYAKIGEGVLLNNATVISHHSIIGQCCFLAPSVTLSGKVQIGNNCFIGSGTIIKDSVIVTNSVNIGAGSLVINNISESGTYVGGPNLRKL